jgi:ABC-2 type transport system permease protein
MDEVVRGIWVIAYRDLLRFMQERARLIASFAMPLLFLVIFGAGFNRVIGAMAPGVDFIQFMYPGIMAMSILMSSLMSGLSIVWDREFGFLKEVLVAPLSRTGIVLGKASGTAVIALGQGFVILVLAPIVGVKLNAMMVVKLIPLLILVSLSLSSLGILMASRMRSQQGFQMLMQIIIMPLVFLSGVFFPVNNVPTWLEVISKINPLTYGIDAIRQVFLSVNLAPAVGEMTGGVSPIGVTVFGHTMTVLDDALVVAAFGIVLLFLAVWSFNKQE